MSKYMKIRERQSEQFMINTRNFFPTKKYHLLKMQVSNSNTKSVSFLLASLVFILWSFLAAQMLPL